MELKFEVFKNVFYEYEVTFNDGEYLLGSGFYLSDNKSFWEDYCNNKEVTSLMYEYFYVYGTPAGFNSLLYQAISYFLARKKDKLIVGSFFGDMGISSSRADETTTYLKDRLYLSSKWEYLENNVFEKSSDEALLEISSFGELVNAVRISSSDVSGATLYRTSSFQELALNFDKASNTPDLTEILKQDDLFVHFYIDEDGDYKDGIIIKSKTDISDIISEVEKRTNLFISKFKEDFHKKKNVLEVVKLLEELLLNCFDIKTKGTLDL
ncbi:hypothetical protein HBN50_02915 [Halobacteriovorax sp. GB3]|uniref:hypothetical protein n=1 Tax=Halobacteriovorax sp. GB3 TaxID=2719615 RepID=UPI0023615897|nr:hypothetical protein [Halobacteriovorax sp. GB3]MDD0852026.1 hypothetical protein [Halobacteriovorax sp. GB3]